MTRNRYMVSLVLLTFFVISLLTNIINAIIPDIISSFRVSLTAAGFLVFAFFIAYGVVSLFAIGAGMATLQVAINPLLRVAGGEEHYAFNSALAQLVFGSASFISPRIYSYLVLNLKDPSPGQNIFLRILRWLTPSQLPWASIYWIFAISALTMVVLLLFARFPKVQHT